MTIDKEKRAWLYARLGKLMNVIVEEVGDGNINDLSYSRHGFRWAVDGCRRAYEKRFSEKVSIEDLFEICEELHIVEQLKSGVEEDVARDEATRYFGLKLARKNNSVELLASEVCEYIRAGGKFYGVKAKDLPFFERMRRYQRKNGSEETSFASALKVIEEYYFSNVAPLETPEQRLQKEDFAYMSMDEFNKATTRLEHISKLYKIAAQNAESDGSVDMVYNNEEWSDTLSSMELGMTSIEFVSLIFPYDCNYHFKSGRIHANTFDVVERGLAEFVSKFGRDNLLAKLRAKDEHLFNKLRYLATTCYGGSLSVGELVGLYGYDTKTQGIEGQSIDEDKIVAEVRERYTEAIDRYYEQNPNVDTINMKEVNKLMDLKSVPWLYTALVRLARLKGVSLRDYINGKEIFAFDRVMTTNGLKLEKKQRNGVLVPALTYDISLGRELCETIIIHNGREYTKLLKQKLMSKTFDNDIINNTNLPREMKINERVRLALEVIDEMASESSRCNDNKCDESES